MRDLVDASGAVSNHLVYDAFGNVLSETDANVNHAYGFTGFERDDETGLSHSQTRYFDPIVGRWTQEDWIGFSADDTNLQRYVANNPILLVDPTGLASAAVENYVGIALLGLWAKRGMMLYVPPVVPPNSAAIAGNKLENAIWQWTGVPIPGLTHAVKTNAHVAMAVAIKTASIRNELAGQPVGNYQGKGSYTLKFFPEKTAMEYTFSSSQLRYNYKASVTVNANGLKCVNGTIDWEFHDEVDANSYFELYRKGSFDWDVPLMNKLMNLIEGNSDITFDKLAGANYDANVTWTTTF